MRSAQGNWNGRMSLVVGVSQVDRCRLMLDPCKLTGKIGWRNSHRTEQQAPYATSPLKHPLGTTRSPNDTAQTQPTLPKPRLTFLFVFQPRAAQHTRKAPSFPKTQFHLIRCSANHKPSDFGTSLTIWLECFTTKVRVPGADSTTPRPPQATPL